MATRLFNLTWLKTQTGRDLDSDVNSTTLAFGEKADGTQGAFTFFQGIKNFFKGITALGTLTTSGKLAVVNTSTGEVNYTTVSDLVSAITTNTVELGNMNPVSSNAVKQAINSAGSADLDYYYLRQAGTVSSTETILSFYNSRRYTDYTYIVVAVGNSATNIRNSIIIPTGVLTNGFTVYCTAKFGTAVDGVDITIRSATQYSIIKSTVSENTVYAMIYGIIPKQQALLSKGGDSVH